MRKALVGALLMASVLGVRAEDAAFVLAFGADPGAPLPYAYRYGKFPDGTGTITMRVPLVDQKLAPLLQDMGISYDTARDIVTRLHQERAYKSVGDCDVVRKVLEERIAAVMPTPYTGPDPVWQHQTADGRAVGGVRCQVERFYPYPVLVFDLSETPR